MLVDLFAILTYLIAFRVLLIAIYHLHLYSECMHCMAATAARVSGAAASTIRNMGAGRTYSKSTGIRKLAPRNNHRPVSELVPRRSRLSDEKVQGVYDDYTQRVESGTAPKEAAGKLHRALYFWHIILYIIES